VGLVRSFARERYLSFDARYDRDAMVGTSWGVQVGGGIPLSQRLSFLAEAGTRRGTQRETWVRAGLRVRLGDRGQAQVDASSRGEFSAGVNGSGGIGIGAWNADANFSRRTTDASLTASGAIDTNRMTIGAQQDVAWNRAGAVTDARTTLRTAFSLAFADGTFALGRPIGEAFVIVKPHRSLRGAPIYLDPQGDGEFARSGALGPALDGALSAHTYRTLAYQVPGAPAGYDLGAGALSLRAPWRGGYKVTIGSDYHLMAVGTLLDKRGDPVKLVSAKAYDLGNRQHPAVLLFTSRSGRFGVQGLRPGRWRIEALTEPAMHYEVNLTDSPDGIARVGPLRPTPVMEQKQ